MDWCTKFPQIIDFINLCDYSIWDVGFILSGTLFWIAAYLIIIKNAFKNKYVEMPVVAGAANIAWEFSWSFLIVTNLGKVFAWGIRTWFLIDILILYCLLQWGSKQYRDPYFRKNFSFITLSQVAFWIPISV